MAGVLIDIDHFFDFAMNHPLRELRHFFRIMYAGDLRKLYVPFHSYELLVLLWCVVLAVPLGAVGLGLSIGLTQHLLCDQIFNHVYPYTYFLSARVWLRFEDKLLVDYSYWHPESELLHGRHTLILQLPDDDETTLAQIREDSRHVEDLRI